MSYKPIGIDGAGAVNQRKLNKMQELTGAIQIKSDVSKRAN